MRILKLSLLFLLRVFGGLLALTQIIGLLPTLSLVQDITVVPNSMLGIIAAKVLIMIGGLGLYIGLKKPFIRLVKQGKLSTPTDMQ